MKAIFYDWGEANNWLFHALNRWHGEVFDNLMQLGTTLGDHNWFALYLAVLAVIACWRVARGAEPQRWLGMLAIFSVAYVLDGALVGWLKHGLDFPRPLVALGPEAVVVVGEPEFRRSFPSGHAVFATTCVASLWPLLARYARIVAAVFVTWVALSRISLGAHFPADVLYGVLIAIAVVLALRLALDRLMLVSRVAGAHTSARRRFSPRRRGR